MKHVIKLTVVLCAILGVILWVTASKQKHMIQSSANRHTQTKPADSATPEGIRNHTKKYEIREMDVREKAYYKIVGREIIPLELEQEVVRERIKDGLLSMTIVDTIRYPDAKIVAMDDAYTRLLDSIPFMDSKFPIWGIEDDAYFVFSGCRGRSQESAFKYGYAVKKENGRIYLWFYSDDK